MRCSSSDFGAKLVDRISEYEVLVDSSRIEEMSESVEVVQAAGGIIVLIFVVVVSSSSSRLRTQFHGEQRREDSNVSMALVALRLL